MGFCSQFSQRQDLIVLGVSMLYLGALIGSIYAWGNSQGWDAATPMSWPDPERFWPKPGTNGLTRTNCSIFDDTYDAPIRRVTTDCYSRWYYWQLPQDQVTVVTRFTVWFLYVIHQVAHWTLLWFAQKERADSNVEKEAYYSGKLRWYNWALLGVTYLFHVLHLVQTHLTYDATAKDVVIQSSQGSVIMMLVFVMLLEYRDRGMFFGWPSQYSDDKIAKKIYLSPTPIEYVRKYHGYAFSWAVIYTFWYHPMENTMGHALGFCHTFLVMVQGSLVYCRIHLSKPWRLLLECWVWFHGFSVAVMVSTGLWWEEMAPFMFGFGFGTLFFVTQIFGLQMWREISPWWRLLPGIVWFIFAIVTVTAIPEVKNSFLSGLVTIPAGQWGCAFAAWLIIYAFSWLKFDKLSNFGPAFHAASTFLIYGLFIIVSFLFQEFGTSVEIPFMAVTYILVFLFIIGCILTWFCLPTPEKITKIWQNEQRISTLQITSEAADDENSPSTNDSEVDSSEEKRPSKTSNL